MHTVDALRHSLYGWSEGVERELLYSAEIGDVLDAALQAIQAYIGIYEVEIKSP